ncbi:MAG: hypothetical protein R2788_09790 [Saprospiraceae bacterium]
MVAHYPFDGNANDATPYMNHGVIGGDPIFEPSTHPHGGGMNIKFDGMMDLHTSNAVHLCLILRPFLDQGRWPKSG